MTRIRSLLCLIAFPLFCSTVVWAQQGGGGNAGGGAGGGAAGGGSGNNQGSSSGIIIDPQGVVSLAIAVDGSGTLDKKKRDAVARQTLSKDVNRKSKRRLVSLVELERQVGDELLQNAVVSSESFYLAGLQRIDYVFVFPEEHDLVIAGPAEGFVSDSVGRMIGVESGRPALRIDDLFVALRTVPNGGNVGCSIDPVPERLAELRRFIKDSVPSSIDEVAARFDRMPEILGLQNVRIDGVPVDSHFATILVEADYRMKRISIGLETPAINGIKSHLATTSGNGNSMQRWWFIPSYDAIYRSDDGLAYQFTGPRAKLLAEDEIIDEQGNRTSAKKTKKTTLAFSKSFTEKFAALADKSPVFGELQNLIDWSILAALFSKENLAQRVGWKQELFLDENRLSYPKFDVPKKIASQGNSRQDASMVVGLVGGGVVVNPRKSLESAIVPARNSAALESTRSTAGAATKTDAHHWWWDSEP